MLVYLHLPFQEHSNLNQNIVDALLSEFASSLSKGGHYIVIDRQTADYIKENFLLSSDRRATIDFLYSRFTQDAQLVESVFPCVILNSVSNEDSGDDGVFYISITSFLSNEYYGKPRLLVEDKVRDGEFFSFLLEIAKKEVRAENLYYEIAHGGGSGLVGNFMSFIESKTAVVALFDSDKKTPACASSDKLKSIKRRLPSSSCTPHMVIELPCHEIENIPPISSKRAIPFSIGMSNDDILLFDECMRCLDAIEAYEERSGVPDTDRFILFFDNKKGLKYDDVTLMNNVNKKKYLLGILKAANKCSEKSFIPPINVNLSSVFVSTDVLKSTLFSDLKKCRFWISIYSIIFRKIACFFYAFRARPSF